MTNHVNDAKKALKLAKEWAWEKDPVVSALDQMISENEWLRGLLENPPKHIYWRPGEPDCPREIKAGNGEIHTLRCKVCGLDNPRDAICRVPLAPPAGPPTDRCNQCGAYVWKAVPDEHSLTKPVMTDRDDLIRQAREMLEGVTEGPWSAEDPMDFELTIVQGGLQVYEWKTIAAVPLREGRDPDEFPKTVAERNARFIAWARTGVPALIAELEKRNG